MQLNPSSPILDEKLLRFLEQLRSQQENILRKLDEKKQASYQLLYTTMRSITTDIPEKSPSELTEEHTILTNSVKKIFTDNLKEYEVVSKCGDIFQRLLDDYVGIQKTVQIIEKTLDFQVWAANLKSEITNFVAASKIFCNQVLALPIETEREKLPIFDSPLKLLQSKAQKIQELLKPNQPSLQNLSRSGSSLEEAVDRFGMNKNPNDPNFRELGVCCTDLLDYLHKKWKPASARFTLAKMKLMILQDLSRIKPLYNKLSMQISNVQNRVERALKSYQANLVQGATPIENPQEELKVDYEDLSKSYQEILQEWLTLSKEHQLKKKNFEKIKNEKIDQSFLMQNSTQVNEEMAILDKEKNSLMITFQNELMIPYSNLCKDFKNLYTSLDNIYSIVSSGSKERPHEKHLRNLSSSQELFEIAQEIDSLNWS